MSVYLITDHSHMLFGTPGFHASHEIIVYPIEQMRAIRNLCIP